MTDTAIVNILAEMGVSMTCRRMVSVPVERADMFDKDATHWQILVKRGDNHRMSFEYSMGSGHKGNPRLDDVFHCCLTDSSIAEEHENASDMAESFGMETDTPEQRRKVMEIWSACVKMRARMKLMFTDEEIEELHEIFQDF